MTDNIDPTDNVIKMPEPLDMIGQRIDASYARAQQDHLEWIEGTLELAQAFADARARFPSHNAFGAWCGENGHDRITSDDRAALINMAANLPLARIVLEETERHSWRLIWRHEMQDRFRSTAKTAVISPSLTKPHNIPGVQATAVPEMGAVSHQRAGDGPAKTSMLHGRPRAAEVYTTFITPHTRSIIGKAVAERGGGEIWSLILQAIDHGFLTQTDISVAKPTARVLFPNSPRSWWANYDLTNRNHRTHVRDVIMPAAIANRDAILATPERIEEILAAHARSQQQARLENKTFEAVQRLPSNQQEIIMFGERMWPPPFNATYDYDQLRAAIWTLRDLDGWLSGSRSGADLASRGIIVRLTVKWYVEYIDRNLQGEGHTKIKKVFGLIGHLSRLLEKNPQGECRWPPTPVAEGQW